MAPISKRKQRRQRRSSRELERLKQDVQASGILGDNELILQTAGDQEKMSAVLAHFVAPYPEFATTYETYHWLVGVAIIAWNAAVMQASGRPDFLQESMKNAMLPEDRQVREDFLAIIHELMQRKARYFADDRRLIVKYRVSNAKDGYHLSVASIQQRQ